MTATAQAAPASVVSYWDERARDGYDAQPGQNPVRELWSQRVAPLVAAAVGDGAQVLDSGCGTGFLATLLAARGHRVTGQDASPGMLDVAAERSADEGLDVQWLVGPAGAPPDGPFDAVVTRNVLWTLPDPAEAIRAWRKVLRPGGMLLVTDGLWGAAETDEPANEKRFSTHYRAVTEHLPYEAGLDFRRCAELVGDCGFTGITEHTGVFDTAPYPSAPGFFVLAARAPREQLPG